MWEWKENEMKKKMIVTINENHLKMEYIHQRTAFHVVAMTHTHNFHLMASGEAKVNEWVSELSFGRHFKKFSFALGVCAAHPGTHVGQTSYQSEVLMCDAKTNLTRSRSFPRIYSNMIFHENYAKTDFMAWNFNSRKIFLAWNSQVYRFDLLCQQKWNFFFSLQKSDLFGFLSFLHRNLRTFTFDQWLTRNSFSNIWSHSRAYDAMTAQLSKYISFLPFTFSSSSSFVVESIGKLILFTFTVVCLLESSWLLFMFYCNDK